MTTQRWPAAWLLTDERLGSDLDAALQRAAAARAGILVRHYHSPPEERRRIAARVRELGCVLAMAGDPELARDCGALLLHNAAGPALGLSTSRSVHDEAEAEATASGRHALVFVSPVFATASHPGAAVLGEDQALWLAQRCGIPAIALGGMTPARGARLITRGFSGWAAIDYWLRI